MVEVSRPHVSTYWHMEVLKNEIPVTRKREQKWRNSYSDPPLWWQGLSGSGCRPTRPSELRGFLPRSRNRIDQSHSGSEWKLAIRSGITPREDTGEGPSLACKKLSPWKLGILRVTCQDLINILYSYFVAVSAFSTANKPKIYTLSFFFFSCPK